MQAEKKFPSAEDIEAALARRKTNFVCPMCKHDDWATISTDDFHLAMSWRRVRPEGSTPELHHSALFGLTCRTCGFLAPFLLEAFRNFVYGQDN